jgi:transposase-like protein
MPPLDSQCPRCESARACRLADSSDQASVVYYRCEDCAHIWTVERAPSHAVRNVTRLDEPRPLPSH